MEWIPLARWDANSYLIYGLTTAATSVLYCPIMWHSHPVLSRGSDWVSDA